jgi:hypothetical protein
MNYNVGAARGEEDEGEGEGVRTCWVSPSVDSCPPSAHLASPAFRGSCVRRGIDHRRRLSLTRVIPKWKPRPSFSPFRARAHAHAHAHAPAERRDSRRRRRRQRSFASFTIDSSFANLPLQSAGNSNCNDDFMPTCSTNRQSFLQLMQLLRPDVSALITSWRKASSTRLRKYYGPAISNRSS